MTKSVSSWKRGLLTLLLTMSVCTLFAQLSEYGPYNIYVSRQMPPNLPSYSGSFPAAADEGRFINIKIDEISGPLEVNPMEFDLQGPPCPTYNKGRRIPENPVPSATTTFNGSIKVKAGQIPVAGTNIDASVKGKEHGYWTKCSANEKVFYSQIVKVNFVINSIKIEVQDHMVHLCSMDEKTVNILNRNPASGGTITWQVVGNKVDIVQQSDASVRFKKKANVVGAEAIVATLSFGDVVYRDTIKINIGETAFTKAHYDYLLVPGDDIIMKDLLTAGTSRDNLVWRVWRNGVELVFADLVNPKIPQVVGFPRAGDNMTVEVKDNLSRCSNRATFRFYGLAMNAPASTDDGLQARIKIRLDPNAPALEPVLLAPLADKAMDATPNVPSLGNPSNSNVLAFEPLDANLNTKILNMKWFATQANTCNRTAPWNVTFSAKKGARPVSVTYILNASIANINGYARPVNYWTGAILATTNYSIISGWYAYVSGIGTFSKRVQAITSITCPGTSQFHPLVEGEETYHKGQMEGTNGNLCNDMWLTANVYNRLVGLYWYGNDAAQARFFLRAAFIQSMNMERIRCATMMGYPGQQKRCDMEREAKNFTRIQHGFTMPCAYPACP